MKKDILEKIDTLTKTGMKIIEESESENPKYMFQGMDTKLLVKIATGKVNAQEYAKWEMTNRGFGKKGEWLGFDKADKLWKSKIK